MNCENANWDTNHFAVGANVSTLALQPERASMDLEARPRSILVLEDDDVQREILVDQLNSVGLKVLPAASIAEAESILATTKLDMAIMDVNLPDGCGLELCEATVDATATADLPIIVLSSITDPFLVRRTRAAGGHFFISKPYDPNVLLAMIERLLDISL